MKNIFKISLCLAICMLFTSCVQTSASVTPTIQMVLTITPNPSITPTSTANPTSESRPTLIPTIESVEVLDRLKNITIENLDALNKHTLRKVTGWSNGFNSGVWNNNYEGYQWMDNNHLLLFPVVGEIQHPNGTAIDTHAIVINIDSGEIWLPPLDQPQKGSLLLNSTLPYWSPTLGVLITSQTMGGGYTTSQGVSIFDANGNFVARYWGDLIDVSPSGTKILIADDSWVDLKTGKIVDFNWYYGDHSRWRPIWSADETRVYICCYYYGDATTGESYYLSDESTILDGHPDNNLQSLHHSHGMWLNDNFVLAQFDGFSTYRDGYIPLFDISARTFRNFGVIANLPDEFNTMPYVRPSISPNRDYMWIFPGAQSATDPQIYLVDLKTLKSKLYHVGQLDWSANGKYALIGDQVLTLSDKTLRSLPAIPDFEKFSFRIADAWHPTAGAQLIIYADKQKHQFLYLLDIETLTYRHLALPSNFDDDRGISIIWSPNGDHFTLTANDGSLWQMDYPKLENLEQLTLPIEDVKDISWSPDGRYLSYVGGTDIYIVDVESNP